MDIKLRNNKKSFMIAGFLLSLVTLGFMVLYPNFRNRAFEFYESPLEDSDFIRSLFKSNYMLYKELAEAREGKNLTYDQIYFNIVEKTADKDNTSSDFEGNREEAIQYIETEKNILNEDLKETDGYKNLFQQMDYCIIDKENGKVTKNSDGKLEAVILSEKEEKNTALEDYIYYVAMEYDENGLISNLSVRWNDADTLLKIVQGISRESVMGSYKRHLTVHGEEGESERNIEIEVNLPRNVAFVYGITEKQWKSIEGAGPDREYYYWNMEAMNQRSLRTAYIQSGAINVYFICLVVAAFMAFLLPKYASFTLYKRKICRLPLEISLFAAYMFLVSVYDIILNLIINTNKGYYYQALEGFFGTDEFTAYFFVGLFNFICLFLLFTLWFYIISSFVQIRDRGLLDFIRKRSILYKVIDAMKNYGKKSYRDLTSIDLSKETNGILWRIIIANFLILTVICCFWFAGIAALIVYSFLLLLFLKKYFMDLKYQYDHLLKATSEIAEGKLDTFIEKDFGVFEPFKDELRKIQVGFKKAVDDEVKSQRMKTELITNVSHDLKTPLTAIVTYIDLLKEENITEEQRKEYIDILERKSLRLKVLIEDLFEVSKASSKNINLDIQDLDVMNLVRQVSLELEDSLKERELQLKWKLPDKKIILPLDSQKTYRIFENLFGNIAKYAMKGTRVYIQGSALEQGIYIEIKNISSSELDINPQELTERFIRGDKSRNTEGSGLGLAIAKSLVELQNGKMDIDIDGDLFKVVLIW